LSKKKGNAFLTSPTGERTSALVLEASFCGTS
jgi:hypothetical protein